jgi:hypothetical protein
MKWLSFGFALVFTYACSNDSGAHPAAGSSGGGSSSQAGTSGSAQCNDGDCVLVPKGCCAACVPTKGDVEAVLASDEKAATARNCPSGPVACGPCPSSAYDPLHPVVRAACMAGHCTVIDLREEPQSACMTDAECHLADVGCCGSCGGDPSGWISLSSAPQDPFAPVCDPIPPCAPCSLNAQPAVFCADDGHCAVGQRP